MDGVAGIPVVGAGDGANGGMGHDLRRGGGVQKDHVRATAVVAD